MKNPDTQLIAACLKEDRTAQSQLYRLCFPVLMGICLRYCSQEADAAAALNLGFLKILRNLKQKQAHVPFEAWIRRIMINTLVDEYRRQRKYREKVHLQESEQLEVGGPAVDYNEADKRMDAEAIEALIRRLPPVSREVFNLFAIDGYPHKEIAQMLQMSVGTSKWHVAFARKQIQQWLAQAVGQEIYVTR